jgi:hypothetical protein
MSEVEEGLEKKDYLEKLKYQHSLYCGERDKAVVHLNQCLGAVHACEQLIGKLESKGEADNGKA